MHYTVENQLPDTLTYKSVLGFRLVQFQKNYPSLFHPPRDVGLHTGSQEVRDIPQFFQNTPCGHNSFSSANRGIVCFCHPTTKRFLKGIVNLYPQSRHPTPAWDLNLVLQSPTRSPVETMVTGSFTYQSMKTAFLMAIMSAGRIGEIAALMAPLPSSQYSLKIRLLLCHIQS